MKMLPKKIKIGPFIYAFLNNKTSFLAACLVEQRHDAMGFTNTKTLELILEQGLAPGAEREVSLHEACHAIVYTMGIDMDRELEERVVNAFGVGMLQLIRDNPQYIEYLQQKD